MYSYPNKNSKHIFLATFLVIVCLFMLNINKVFSATNWLTGNPISDRQIDLNWGGYSGTAKSFTVMVTNKSTPTASDWVTVATLPATTISYSHKDGLGPNTTYKYKVMADGASSNIVSITTKPALVSWAGRAGYTFNRPGKLDTAYYMEWDYTKGVSGWNSVGSNVQGIHSVSGSDSTCSFSTSYTTVCTNGTCTLKPVLNSGSSSCVPSAKLKTVTAPFNNGDYGDPDDPPEANITSWISKSPTCVGPKCTITKVCSNDGKGIAIRRADTQVDYVNSAGESNKILRVDDDITACPSYAPVCGMVGTTPTCQCDNAGGTGAGFYADQKPYIKDILDINVNYDPTYLNSLTVKPALPVSAFDNFYVEVNLKLCPKAGVAAPATGFKVAIVTKDASNNDVIVAQGTLSKYTDAAQQVSYRWNLTGSGKTTGFVTESTPTLIQAQRLQLLLSNVTKGKQPIIRITDVGTGQTKEQVLNMSACGFNTDIFSRINDLSYGYTDDYKLTTLTNRKFTPEITPEHPLSPYDDFFIDFSISRCSSSIPAPSSFPGTLSFQDVYGSNVDITKGTFTKIKEDNWSTYYRWVLSGWPNGVVTEDSDSLTKTTRMKGLLIAITSGQRPKIKITTPEKTSDIGDIFMSPCVHVWGATDGNIHQVVNMAGVSASLDSLGIINRTFDIKRGFETIDPYKKYIDKFSFWADIKSHSDRIADFYDLDNELLQAQYPPLLSNCGGRAALYYFNNSVENKNWTRASSFVVFLGMHMNNTPTGQRLRDFLPIIAVHEGSHAFAGLNDEYVVALFGDLKKDWRNCVKDPDKNYRNPIGTGTLYGDVGVGGCTNESYFRPSQASVMNTSHYAKTGETSLFDPRFNVISCGYIIAKIKGHGHGPDYWEECMTLDTVKPTGVTSFNWRNLVDSNTATLIDAFGRLLKKQD